MQSFESLQNLCLNEIHLKWVSEMKESPLTCVALL